MKMLPKGFARAVENIERGEIVEIMGDGTVKKLREASSVLDTSERRALRRAVRYAMKETSRGGWHGTFETWADQVANQAACVAWERRKCGIRPVGAPLEYAQFARQIVPEEYTGQLIGGQDASREHA